MRNKIFLSIVSILFSFFAFAQDEEETISKVDILYDIHLPLLAIKCLDVSGTPDPRSKPVYIQKGAVFFVLEYLEKGDVLVQFWRQSGSDWRDFNKSVAGGNENNLKLERNTYIINSKDLKNRARRRYSTSFITGKNDVAFSGTSITGGVTVLPFKFRPRVNMNGKRDGFDFSKDIQLGVSGGFKQRISRYNPYFINALFNIGISSVTMDSYNTLGTVTDNTDIAALTFAYGVVIDFNKIQFGIFAGRDRVSDRNRNNWIYQGKTWWSIGFGYSIFSVSTKPIGSGNK